MDLIIFIVGFIIFVVYLIAFLTVIYRQNKIQDQELENDPELDNKQYQYIYLLQLTIYFNKTHAANKK